MLDLLEGMLSRGVSERANAGRHHAIEQAARAELRRSNYRTIRRNVDCEYDNGVVTLRGRLPSFFLKQIAQSAVSHRLKGIAAVDNQLEVTQHASDLAAY